MIFNFISNTKGSVATYFACAVLGVVMAGGVAIDMAGSQKLATKYQNMADAAVLSAAKSRPKEQGPMAEIAQAVITKHNDTGTSPSVTTTLSADRKTLRIELNGAYETALMGMFGKSQMEINVVAETLIQVQDYTDIVLVLDTTASMSYEGRLPALKASALNFLDVIQDLDSDRIRVGVVPYAQYVNIGMANRNKPWADIPADWVEYFPQSCSTHTPQIGTTEPCTEQSYPPTPPTPPTPPSPPSTCSNDGVMYSCGGGGGSPGHPGSPGGTHTVCTPVYGSPTTSCHTPPPVHHKWTGAVGSRSGGGNIVPDYTTGSSKVPGYLDTTPSVEMLPLTTSLASVRAKINALTAYQFTYSPQGLIWGWRMLTDAEPFPAFRPLPAGSTRKRVVIFMTDGLNTLTLGSNGTHTPGSRNQADNTTSQICDGIKTMEEIKVYTITFKVFDNTAKNMVRGCASEPEYYYDATSSTSLHTAFEDIALDLLSPRITH